MRSLPCFAEGCLQTSLTSYFSSQFISLYVVLEAFILGYSSSQVACKSSSPVPAPAVFQNIEIRLESARAHAASFYSVNQSTHSSAVSAVRIEMGPEEIAITITSRLHQKRSQNVWNPKFSWGGHAPRRP